MVSAGIWLVGWLLGLSLACEVPEEDRLDVVAEATVAWWRLVASDDSPGRVFAGRGEVEALWAGLAQDSFSV